MVSARLRNSRHKPSKPYPSFPLTAHNNGQRCKKIRGKVHFFGVWGEPQTALDAYLRIAPDLHAGRQPAHKNISAEGMLVKDVCNYFLTYQLAKLNEGNLTARWFEDCRKTARAFAKCVGSTRLVSELTPDDFQHFRQRLSQVGIRDKGDGLGVFALARDTATLGRYAAPCRFFRPSSCLLALSGIEGVPHAFVVSPDARENVTPQTVPRTRTALIT